MLYRKRGGSESFEKSLRKLTIIPLVHPIKLLMRQSFTERPRSANPNQDMAGTLHSKSLLQSRNVDRLTGSKFFNDNRIRTCSYIKQNGNTFTAVPFYDKRNTK